MGWRPTGETLKVRTTQVAVQILDDYRGGRPATAVTVWLEALDPTLGWVPSGIEPAVTSTGVYTWPNLERRAGAAGLPSRKYRVLAHSAVSQALYPNPTDPGLPFDVQPHNDAVSAPSLQVPTPLYLLPTPTYPFPTHVRVVRGRVLDGTAAAAGALVAEGARERVLTDSNGAFALPLRWPPRTASGLVIDADGRNGRIGSITVNLPADLGKGHDIAIN